MEKVLILTMLAIPCMAFSEQVCFEKITEKDSKHEKTYFAAMTESEVYLDVDKNDFKLSIHANSTDACIGIDYWLTSKNKKYKVNSKKKTVTGYESDLGHNRRDPLSKSVWQFKNLQNTKIFKSLSSSDKMNCVLHIQLSNLNSREHGRLIHDIDLTELYALIRDAKDYKLKSTVANYSPAEYVVKMPTNEVQFSCYASIGTLGFSSVCDDKTKYYFADMMIQKGLFENSEIVYPYFQKDTEVGKRIYDILKEGKKFSGKATLRYHKDEKNEKAPELVDFVKYF